LVYTHNSNASLITSRISTINIDDSGSICFIYTAVRIVGLHGIAVLGADAVSLDYTVEVVLIGHTLIASGIVCRKRGSNLITIPITRLEQSLVIVTGQRCRFVFLDERTLAATLATGTDLHNERHIVAARSHTGSEGLHFAIIRNLHTAVGRMVLKGNGSGNDPGTKCWRGFFLIADATALGGMFCAEPCGLQDARGMMGFGTECSGDLIGDIHTIATLVIEYDAVSAGTHAAVYTEGRRNIARQFSVVSVKACCSRAILNTAGSSLPRAEALRRIP